MDKIRVYKILASKFNESEAETIIDYVESAKRCKTPSGMDLTERVQKLELDLKLQYHKLDKKIIMGLIIVMGITLILIKSLAQAVLK
ncbi:MAG: hypothetical protein NT178_18120 [Proteobacteria bacterium]|nr:hypothetical protein [Pseudomonadota bacterium]